MKTFENYSGEEQKHPIDEVLFYPWNEEGEANMEYLEFLRDVNDELMDRDDYVATSGFGSQFKGYANETSDFDIILIGGDSKVDTVNELGKQVKSIGEKYGKKAEIPFLHSKSYFESNLRPREKEYENQDYSHALWPLAFPLVGKKEIIKELRASARAKHESQLAQVPEGAHRNIENAVNVLIYWELGIHLENLKNMDSIPSGEASVFQRTSRKIQERGYTKEELVEIAYKRADLWRQRITDLVEGKGEFAE